MGIVKSVQYHAQRAYDGLDNIFTEKEAWGLFKLAAFVETFGWICLIIAIITVRLQVPYSDNYVALAGSFHGLFLIVYIFIVIFAHRSLKWSIKRFLFAEVIANVPLGALVFEQWVSMRRKKGKI